jgi:hypothetical protein
MKSLLIVLLAETLLLLAPVSCYFTSSLRSLSHHHTPGTVSTSTALHIHMSSSASATTMHMNVNNKVLPKIAVIGGGAAGLAAARVFSRAGWSPFVLEKGGTVGGVWKYKSEDEQQQGEQEQQPQGPMYRGLRTNLPKEIMAYREFPWLDDTTNNEGPDATDSFVTHAQVLKYLQAYTDKFDLKQYIHTGCQVEQLTVLEDNSSSSGSSLVSGTAEKWPRIQLDWRCTSTGDDDSTTTTTSAHSDTFDAVCVCNGHYSVPAFPDLPGLDGNFKGEIMHSMAYDDPAQFQGQTVLCIGGRASGADLAREIAKHAASVYLSDSTTPPTDETTGSPLTKYNVTWVPKTLAVLPDGSMQFDFADDGGCSSETLSTPVMVDVIIFCTGYDYSFPFCNAQSNLPFAAPAGSRRVTPLYDQLWHAAYPNVAFLGLCHSVIPFPLFELQSEAVLATWATNNVNSNTIGDSGGSGDSSVLHVLPDENTRMQQAALDAASGGQGKERGTGRVPQDTHFLGSAQWDYCRRMGEYAGLYNDNMRDYLATNKVCYVMLCYC